MNILFTPFTLAYVWTHPSYSWIMFERSDFWVLLVNLDTSLQPDLPPLSCRLICVVRRRHGVWRVVKNGNFTKLVNILSTKPGIHSETAMWSLYKTFYSLVKTQQKQQEILEMPSYTSATLSTRSDVLLVLFEEPFFSHFFFVESSCVMGFVKPAARRSQQPQDFLLVSRFEQLMCELLGE